MRCTYEVAAVMVVGVGGVLINMQVSQSSIATGVSVMRRRRFAAW